MKKLKIVYWYQLGEIAVIICWDSVHWMGKSINAIKYLKYTAEF